MARQPEGDGARPAPSRSCTSVVRQPVSSLRRTGTSSTPSRACALNWLHLGGSSPAKSQSPKCVDLRTAEAQDLVGLDEASLRSEVGDNARCQAVASTAHGLGAHGIVAPAATGLGETLALFTTHLPTSEMPLITSVAIWDRLPPDPRRLRSVNEESG